MTKSELDDLRADNESLRASAGALDELTSRLTTELSETEQALAALDAENDELRAENERLRAVVAEVRKLEAIDHGVAWPDLCHALHELDRPNLG